jgi:hypothetical protein
VVDRLDRIERLDLADHEFEMLDRLKERAGIVWTCHGVPGDEHLPWTMDENEPCEDCGRKNPDATS